MRCPFEIQYVRGPVCHKQSGIGCMAERERERERERLNETARMDEERGLGSDVDERMWNAAKSPCVNKQIC